MTNIKTIYDCLIVEIALHNALVAYVIDTTGIDLDGIDFEESLNLELAEKDAEEIYGIASPS